MHELSIAQAIVSLAAEEAVQADAQRIKALTVEVGNLSLVGRFVAAGLGVAPVPAVAFGPRDLLPGVERRRVAGISPVAYDRAVRTGSPISPPTERLLELLRKAHA